MSSLPVLGFAVLPAFQKAELEPADLGPLDLYPENEWRESTFLLDPGSGEVSRRTAFVRSNGDVDGVPNMTILSNRCVHLGCPVQPAAPARTSAARRSSPMSRGRIDGDPVQPANFSCPCHGGAYDLEGNRIAGPPVRALDRYAFEISGNLKLLLPYSVGEVEGQGRTPRSSHQHQGPGSTSTASPPSCTPSSPKTWSTNDSWPSSPPSRNRKQGMMAKVGHIVMIPLDWLEERSGSSAASSTSSSGKSPPTSTGSRRSAPPR